MTSFFLGYNIATGAGLSFNSATNVLSNSGVLSLQGDTGSLSLVAGTGISISGLTISNAGIVSASAGNGISVSGSDPLTIAMTGSYSGNFTVSGSGDSNVNFVVNGRMQTGDSNNNGGIWVNTPNTMFVGAYGVSKIGFYNNGKWGLKLSSTAAVTTYNNTLDNGSGDMSIAGTLSVSGEISGGSYNLTGGTGISFSGVTITNTGIISASAGDGITVSGTNPLTIGMSGSYSGNMTVGGLTQIPNGLEDSTVDTPAAPSQALFHNFTTNDITGARWSMHNGYYRWNLAQETTTAGTFQDILSIDTGQSPGVGSDIYFRALDTSLPLHFVSFPSYSFDNSLSVDGGTFTINESVSTTAGTYLDAIIFDINSNNRFYHQVYASEGKTSSTDGDYWFVGWGATGQHLLTVYGSGNVSIAGVLNTAGSVIIAENSTGAFSGYDNTGNIRYWLGYQDGGSNDLYLRNPAPSSNLYLGATVGIYTGNTSVPPSIRNTLDDGSGNMNVAGVITSGNKVTYTSGSGTFTVPSGISMLKVYLIGAGGGGGGGSDYNTTYSASGGGGGGGGGAFISLELPVNSGQGISYSVGGGGSGGATGTDGSNGGTGGATHFGGFYANGGSGGSGAGSTSNGGGGSGGSGGSYQVLNEDGGAGEDNPTVGKGGSGGGSYNGFNYGVGGAGGNGGTSANHSGNPGDTGGDGAIIIYMS